MTLKIIGGERLLSKDGSDVRERQRLNPLSLCLPLLSLLAVFTVLFIISTHPENIQYQQRAPRPAGYSRLYPNNITLIDLPEFRYVINNDVCQRQPVDILILVTSHEGDQDLRAAWRRLLNSSDLETLGAKRVFLLGRPSRQAGYTSVSETLVEEESAKYGDLVQGNFLESYRNLTYKHVMGLQWAITYCPQARYILKMDDDIAIDIFQIIDKVRNRYRAQDLLLGLIHYDMRPVRDTTSKWYVSESEYKDEFYRPFLSGWMYVCSQDVAHRLVVASRRVPYFWIDDVHVTGTLASRQGIKPSSFNAYFTPHLDHLECCVRTRELLCDFMVGPSGGDVAVLRDFLGQARACWVAKCSRRPKENAIARTCVGTGKYRHVAPARGTAEVVPVSWSVG